MRRAVLGLGLAVVLHAVGGWALAGSRVAAQLLSPGPHALVAGALMSGFVLLRIFLLVVAPGLLVAGLIVALDRSRRWIVNPPKSSLGDPTGS